MPTYTLLIYGSDLDVAAIPPEAWAASMDAHAAFARAVTEKGGRILHGEALEGTAAATSIRDGVVTDGPFVETKETLGGFYLVEARDLDHMVELARLCPVMDGGVEIRPVADTSGA